MSEAQESLPVKSIEVDEALDNEDEVMDAEAEGQGEAEGEGEGSDNDAPGEIDDDTVDVVDSNDGKLSNDLYKAFKAITEVLLNYKTKGRGNEDHFPATLFKRLPNKRLLPDYYEVIKDPSAISTLRGKIQRKQYAGVSEFVRDFALVVHNAQLYNRPNSQPVRDVLKLDEVFKAELLKLVDEALATEEEIAYPNLGEIPYASPEPDPVSNDDEDDGDGDMDGDGDDEEDDEEADDSDDDKRKRRGRRGTKSTTGKKGEDEEDDDKGGDGEQKRRGRPPKVATPMEHRIDRILKSLKKPKSENGVSILAPFERLPDKAELPEYYQVIKDPMAYDLLKKKAKRKKYQSIVDFMKDVELMFNNAMAFNEDGSDIHRWAQELFAEAKRVEKEERARPDSEYLSAAEGRIPLPHIFSKGDTWKVGDWIHIQNSNDVTKPIVAQIYRTWKTGNDEEWINACWYYRPEQTVHQYEKHFYPSEVVKTGQYRDHKIEEVLNKCFVMFYTRYSRGRPRNLPADAEVYVCEARYNEDKFKFNKIKTWASCLPDEVRDKDYEMDLFDAPRKIKKVPSPLLSRLKEDARETDDLPQPEWKHTNAPPLVGGIHKRPREENQSPPPEPTPPPQPAPLPVIRTPSVGQNDSMRVPVYPQTQPSKVPTPSARPPASMTPQSSFATTAGQYSRPTSYAGATHPYASQTPAPQQSANQQYQYTAQQPLPAPTTASQSTNFNTVTPAINYTRPAPVQAVTYNAQHINSGIQQRTAEAYILSDVANASIPKDVREQFPRDEQGRVLFFTSPPLNTEHLVSGSSSAEHGRPLTHTDKHMKALAVRKRKFMEAEKDRGLDVEMLDSHSTTASKHTKVTTFDERTARNGSDHVNNSANFVSTKNAVEVLVKQMKQNTYDEYKDRYGDDWRQVLLADLEWGNQRRQEDTKRDDEAEERRREFSVMHLGRNNGQYALNTQGYVSGWYTDLFTGTYLDDHDSRLP